MMLNTQTRTEAGDYISLNISGFPYKIPREVTHKLPNFKMTSSQNEYSFDRPRQCFEAIYNFCVVGKLHIPPTVCTGEFLEELEFWGVEAGTLEKCCHHRYVLFMREQENLRGFIRCTEKEESQNDNLDKTPRTGWKGRAWKVLDSRDDRPETKVRG